MLWLRFVVAALVVTQAVGLGAQTVSLAGAWGFRLDPQNVGIRESWWMNALPDRCRLPGSTDENGFGTRNLRKPSFDYLARVVEYVGPAWYQRQVDIPAAWKGKHVTLFLERCHWETRVWVDGQAAGMRDSLCVPHVYDLSALLKPGRHRLTIRVDNSHKYDMGAWAHSTSEQTQTNWNGIIGRIELRATPPVWVEDVQVYPMGRLAQMLVTVGNTTGKPVSCEITGSLTDRAIGPPAEPAARQTGRLDASPGTSQTGLALATDVRLGGWDEFSPSLCYANVKLKGGDLSDEKVVSFGMRDLRAEGKKLVLNGRTTQIRATLECCIFPKTGYPPMDVESWLREIRIAKSYGLNGLRFHSWCPPEAAFEAADREGFLFHVELPEWVGNAGKDPPRDKFIEEEEKRILDAYGNHPSFGMLCMGNELGGDPEWLQHLVKLGKERDKRHLYTPSTAWSQGAADDYRVVVIRGLHGPGTVADFRDEVAKHPMPTISHEVGQWTIYPNLAEIPKYDGVVRARNFEMIRDDLAARGMLDQAPDFMRASGQLMWRLYKEEIEVLLRTPGHSGFQLLDLHDFPGQGTALVGVLDPFWDSKGLIKPEEWRRFCGPTVPLLRMSKRMLTTDEDSTATVEVSHFGPRDLVGVWPRWDVRDAGGKVVVSGSWPKLNVPTGGLTHLGCISLPLAKLPAPAKYVITVMAGDAANDWDIWVYPGADLKVRAPGWPTDGSGSSLAAGAPSAGDPRPDPRLGDVTVLRDWNAEAIQALEAGKKVLLLVRPKSVVNSIKGIFTPAFWCPIWFPDQPSTMGILCDPKHPALADFPTEYHSNWQWYDLLQRSCSIVLDDTPVGYRPIVQVIDNFARNHRLGNLFEAKVGGGRLMVCSMDLTSDMESRPEARQLLRSILKYMGSEAFAPKQELSVSTLSLVLRATEPTALQKLGAKLVEVDSESPEHEGYNAIDGDPETSWHTRWEGDIPDFPHEIVVDLGRSVALKGFSYLPRQDMKNGWFSDYKFYVSDDGRTWGEAVTSGTFPAAKEQQRVLFGAPRKGRFIRLVALKGLEGHPYCAVAELDVILGEGP